VTEGLDIPPDTGRVLESVVLQVIADVHITEARDRGRALAAQAGFSIGAQAVIAGAISEVARNQVRYARNGTIELRVLAHGMNSGIRVIARDEGPGIPDVDQAMVAGFSSTHRSLGMGLAAARRVMDEFFIVSRVGVGTVVAMAKWRYPRSVRVP